MRVQPTRVQKIAALHWARLYSTQDLFLSTFVAFIQKGPRYQTLDEETKIPLPMRDNWGATTWVKVTRWMIALRCFSQP